ncbi:MAG: hypothetical protein GC137_06185 [Alphaproteobacteria bacterium]|nr:hypothetical protein [Alphaproteobacteria bacterium]
MRFVLILITVFTLSFSSKVAHALSCAQLEFDEKYIAQSDLIFRGTVMETGSKIEDKEGISEIIYYKFSIEKLWKGETDANVVMIGHDNYWGDIFVENEEYLVVAKKTEAGDYIAHLCGATDHMGNESAKEKVEFLNKLYNHENQEQK